MADYNMIPEGLSFNGIARFINGRDWEFEPTFIPKSIGFTVHQLSQLVQDGSHAEASTEGELNLELDDYFKNSHTDHLYRSIIHQLLDFLSWIKIQFDHHGPNLNEQYWRTKREELCIDEINNGWGKIYGDTGINLLSIHKDVISDLALQIGDKISFTRKVNKGKPDFAINVQKC